MVGRCAFSLLEMLVLFGPSKDTVLSPQGPHPWSSSSLRLHALFPRLAPHTCLAKRAFCGTTQGSSVDEVARYRGSQLGSLCFAGCCTYPVSAEMVPKQQRERENPILIVFSNHAYLASQPLQCYRDFREIEK